MNQLDKVLKAFELCPKHGCHDCPYFNTYYEECEFETLAQDATNIIKELLNRKNSTEEEHPWDVCYGGSDC